MSKNFLIIAFLSLQIFLTSCEQKRFMKYDSSYSNMLDENSTNAVRFEKFSLLVSDDTSRVSELYFNTCYCENTDDTTKVFIGSDGFQISFLTFTLIDGDLIHVGYTKNNDRGGLWSEMSSKEYNLILNIENSLIQGDIKKVLFENDSVLYRISGEFKCAIN